MSSIPLAAALSSKMMFLIASNSGIGALASAVNMSYDDSKLDTIEHKPLVGEECSFQASSNTRRDSAADTGILGSCTDPNHICVEAKQSSMGGRCTIVNLQRELQTTCTMKCDGVDACGGGTDMNIIGDRSCCGYRACYGITGAHPTDTKVLTCSISCCSNTSSIAV